MSPSRVFGEFQSYVQNPSEYIHYHEGFTVYTTALDTSALRNILTTAFVVLNFFIVLVGGSFLRQRNLVRLRTKSRPVAINHLTSWMTLKSSFMYVLHTWRLPGGSAGFTLMLLTGAFGIVHQYFVNSFILPEPMHGKCTFESGIVTTLHQNEIVPYPVSTFSAARTALNAQVYAGANDGEFGIYDKVNSTYTIFKPTIDDVIGWWTCTYEPPTVITATDWSDSASLQSYLSLQDFLFTSATYYTDVENAHNNVVKGFLLWSADQPEESLQQWNVRASVATNLGSSLAESVSTADVTNLECKLTSKDDSKWTAPIMPSNSSLYEWGRITFGSLMTLSSGYGGYIEWMLNAMVMVGGSGNNDQLNQTSLHPGESLKYGCGIPGSKIKPGVWVILIVMFLLFALLVLADVMMRLYHCFQREDIAGGDLAKETPSGVENWQLLLLQAMMKDKTIKLADMRDYEYKWDKDNQTYAIRKRDSPSWATPSIDPASAA